MPNSGAWINKGCRGLRGEVGLRSGWEIGGNPWRGNVLAAVVIFLGL